MQANMTYYIVVDGYSGASGEYVLSITCPKCVLQQTNSISAAAATPAPYVTAWLPMASTDQVLAVVGATPVTYASNISSSSGSPSPTVDDGSSGNVVILGPVSTVGQSPAALSAAPSRTGGSSARRTMSGDDIAPTLNPPASSSAGVPDEGSSPSTQGTNQNNFWEIGSTGQFHASSEGLASKATSTNAPAAALAAPAFAPALQGPSKGVDAATGLGADSEYASAGTMDKDSAVKPAWAMFGSPTCSADGTVCSPAPTHK